MVHCKWWIEPLGGFQVLPSLNPHFFFCPSSYLCPLHSQLCASVSLSCRLNVCCCSVNTHCYHFCSSFKHISVTSRFIYTQSSHHISPFNYCFVSSVLVSLCPFQLQGTAPLIWPFVHLIHLSRLQSEDQKDSHGSVQVTNTFLFILFLTVFQLSLPLLPLLSS